MLSDNLLLADNPSEYLIAATGSEALRHADHAFFPVVVSTQMLASGNMI